jgi:hypothetical protein
VDHDELTGGVEGLAGKIRSSAIVRGIAVGEDSCSIRENARIRVPGIVGADHEQASGLIEMAEEGTGRFAHVFVPLGKPSPWIVQQ